LQLRHQVFEQQGLRLDQLVGAQRLHDSIARRFESCVSDGQPCKGTLAFTAEDRLPQRDQRMLGRHAGGLDAFVLRAALGRVGEHEQAEQRACDVAAVGLDVRQHHQLRQAVAGDAGELHLHAAGLHDVEAGHHRHQRADASKTQHEASGNLHVVAP